MKPISPFLLACLLLAATSGFFGGVFIWPPETEAGTPRTSSGEAFSLVAHGRERPAAPLPESLRQAAKAALLWQDHTPFGDAMEAGLTALLHPEAIIQLLKAEGESDSWLAHDSLEAETAFRVIAENDPERAYSLARALPRSAAQSRGLTIAIAGAYRTNPDRAKQMLHESCFMIHDTGDLVSFFRADPAGLANFAKELPPSFLRGAVSRDLSKIWVEADLESAKAYFEQSPTERENGALGRAIAVKMGEHDVDAAIAWAEAHLGTRQRRYVVAEVVSALVGEDPRMAVEKAKTLADRHPNLKNYVITRWATDDLDAALEWVTTESDAMTQAETANTFFDHLAVRDPPAALRHWETVRPDDPISDTQLSRLASGWSALDPAAAVSWSLALDDPARTERMLDVIGAELIRTDPVGAGALFAPIDPALVSQRTVKQLFRALEKANQTEAARWRDRMQTESLGE